MNINLFLNQDLNETYGNNQAYNVNENILINYNNNLTKLLVLIHLY